MVTPVRTDSVRASSATQREVPAQTRFFGTVEGDVKVVLDASGQRGALSADVPLDSFSPRLSAVTLATLSLRFGMPPNEEQPQPATLIQRGGRAFLHLELRDAETNALKVSPFVVSVGDPASLSGSTMAPEFMLQINASTLKVDLTQPVLRAEQEARVERAKLVSSLESSKAAMVDGTSSWFGDRQLKVENDRLTAQLASNTEALGRPLAAAEQALASASSFSAAFSLPPEAGAPRDALLQAATEASNLGARVTELESRQASFAGVPSQLTLIAAELATVRPRAARAAAEVQSQVTSLYAKTRAENPQLADHWLMNFVKMTPTPGTEALAQLVGERTGLRMSLDVTSGDLARVTARAAESRAPRIAQLTEQLAEARAALADSDARIAALSQGPDVNVKTFSTTYDPASRFI